MSALRRCQKQTRDAQPTVHYTLPKRLRFDNAVAMMVVPFGTLSVALMWAWRI